MVFQKIDRLFGCSTDKTSESAILEVVRKNFKGHLILGEEGGLIGDASSEYLWCIDPLGLILHVLYTSPAFICMILHLHY